MASQGIADPDSCDKAGGEQSLENKEIRAEDEGSSCSHIDGKREQRIVNVPVESFTRIDALKYPQKPAFVMRTIAGKRDHATQRYNARAADPCETHGDSLGKGVGNARKRLAAIQRSNHCSPFAGLLAV